MGDVLSLKVSIVIRTKNEAVSLPDCLARIKSQKNISTEVIIVDSGSTDQTVQIALKAGCRVIHILPTEFTFGRSLNRGIQEATGDIIVVISAHCLPKDEQYLSRLLQPFCDFADLVGVYGRQIPFSDASPIEVRGLLEAFPPENSFRISATNMFSNAHSAIRKDVWKEIPFNEQLTGAEDIDWATQVREKGWSIGYEPRSVVFHSHHETLTTLFNRFFRETRALKIIQSSYYVPHGILGYIFRYFRSVVLDEWFLLTSSFSLRYKLKWSILVLLNRLFIYYGQFKGSRENDR